MVGRWMGVDGLGWVGGWIGWWVGSRAEQRERRVGDRRGKR